MSSHFIQVSKPNGSLLMEKEKNSLLHYLSFSVTAAMFLTILLLATSTVVILLGLNVNQIAIAQQEQQ